MSNDPPRLSFPFVPSNTATSNHGNKVQFYDAYENEGDSAVARSNKTAATSVGESSSGPNFKDQFREANAPIPAADDKAREHVPTVQASPVDPSASNDESVDAEQQDLEERRLRVERERQELQQQRQQQQSQESQSNGSGFNKKKWSVVGVISFLVILVASLSITLAIRNRSSVGLSPVVAPTVPPLPRRAILIRDFINSLTLSPRTLSYPSDESPEEQSLRWLIEDDGATDVSFIISGMGNSTSVDKIQFIQRFVLATMWFGNGPFNVPHNDTWVTDTSECEWLGVRCVNGEATRVALRTDGLSGSIPADVGLLTALTVLELNENELTGALPSQIGVITALTTLTLEQNRLTGSIPTEIGSLTTLTNMQLGGNGLNGSIPSQIGLLTQLNTLGLNNNRFSGSIPDQFLALTSLSTFRVHANELTGVMPFCTSDSIRIRDLIADCLIEIECTCCTLCF